MAATNAFTKIANTFKSAVFQRYADHTDKFLTDTAAIGWFLASAANMCGVMFNKKIDPKDKKYLIPQEMADGITNVGLFYLLTNSLIKGSKKAFEKGVDSGFIKGIVKNTDAFNTVKSGVGVAASLIGAVFCSNVLTPLVRNNYAASMQKKYLEAMAKSRTVGYSLPMFRDLNVQKTRQGWREWVKLRHL
jgi:hypothetical protein